MMTEEAKQAKRDYMREWRKRNKDRVANTQARYWQRKADQAKAAKEGEADVSRG